MTTSYATFAAAEQWHEFWRGSIGNWIPHRGLRIVVLVVVSLLAVRLINWLAQRITRRLDVQEGDALARSVSVPSAESTQWFFIIVEKQYGFRDLPPDSATATARCSRSPTARS